MTFLFLCLKVHMFTGGILKIIRAPFFFFFIFWGGGGHKIWVMVGVSSLSGGEWGHKIWVLVWGFNIPLVQTYSRSAYRLHITIHFLDQIINRVKNHTPTTPPTVSLRAPAQHLQNEREARFFSFFPARKNYHRQVGLANYVDNYGT